ncbi:MAG TPA: phosphatase PAP2 family protein [Desulfobacteria bacterium]|nr:phosphatase PAP2 family protein [Desulfobacteria bacterium]
MNSFDLKLYHLINGAAGHHPFLDRFMAVIANYSLEVYIVLFVIAWFALPRPTVKERHALVIMGLAGVLGLIINIIISHIWFRPRPFRVLPQGSFTQLIPHSPDASFPSDHTTGSFGFAAGSWGKSAKWVRISFTLLAVLNAIARVYAGVHWPTDVLAGMVVGIICGRLMWKFSRQIEPLTNFGLRLFRFGKFAKKYA